MTPLEKLKKLAKKYKFEDLMAIEHVQSGYDAHLPLNGSAAALIAARNWLKKNKKGEKL